MGALAFASGVLELLPLVVKGVMGAAEAMREGAAAVKAMVSEGRDPTDAEWATLNEATDRLRAALQSDDR